MDGLMFTDIYLYKNNRWECVTIDPLSPLPPARYDATCDVKDNLLYVPAPVCISIMMVVIGQMIGESLQESVLKK
jgi:hypothetical protein